MGTGKVRDHGTEATRKTIEHWTGQDPHVYRQRVVISQDVGDEIPITGEITPVAIDEEVSVSGKTIGTTAEKFVNTPMVGRRLIMIRNNHPTSSLWIGSNGGITSGFVDGGTNIGWEVGPNETFNTLSGPNIDWYGLTSSGTIDCYFGEAK